MEKRSLVPLGYYPSLLAWIPVTLVPCSLKMEEGLHHPIVFYEDQILDDRNRFRACFVARVDPEFMEYKGDNPLSYVMSLNLHRRHLTVSQRAYLAAEVANMTSGTRTDLEPSAKLREVSQPEAAEKLDVSERYVQEAKKIKRQSPEHFERIGSGELTIQQAKRELNPSPSPSEEEVNQMEILEQETELTPSEEPEVLIEYEGQTIRSQSDLVKSVDNTPLLRQVTKWDDFTAQVSKANVLLVRIGFSIRYIEGRGDGIRHT